MPALLDALIGTDQAARKWAAEALGSIGDTSVAQELMKPLTTPTWKCSVPPSPHWATSANAPSTLIDVLQDDNVDLAKAAAEALGKIRSEVAIEPLIGALQSPSADVRKVAADLLRRVGRSRVPALIEAVRSGDAVMRRWGVEVLGEIADDRALNLLVESLADEEERVGRFAAVALVRLGTESSFKYLAPLLEHPNKDIRYAAVEGLSGTCSYKAVEYVAACLHDEDWVVRMTAACGLGEIGSRTCVEPLLEALQDEEWSVRRHAAIAATRRDRALRSCSTIPRSAQRGGPRRWASWVASKHRGGAKAVSDDDPKYRLRPKRR